MKSHLRVNSLRWAAIFGPLSSDTKSIKLLAESKGPIDIQKAAKLQLKIEFKTVQIQALALNVNLNISVDM